MPIRTHCASTDVGMFLLESVHKSFAKAEILFLGFFLLPISWFFFTSSKESLLNGRTTQTVFFLLLVFMRLWVFFYFALPGPGVFFLLLHSGLGNPTAKKSATG